MRGPYIFDVIHSGELPAEFPQIYAEFQCPISDSARQKVFV